MGRYNTSGKGETVWLVGELPSGGTVTITIYDLSNGSTVPLTSNVCSEIGITGLYRWDSSNITTQPTIFKQYLYVMSDGINRFVGKFVLGGFTDEVDEVKAKTDNLPADPASESGALAKEATLTPKASQVSVNTLQTDITVIKKIQTNRWKIENNILTIYDDDGITVLKTFNLSGEQTTAYSEKTPI